MKIRHIWVATTQVNIPRWTDSSKKIEWIAPFSWWWPSGSLTRSLKCSSTNFASLSLGLHNELRNNKNVSGIFLVRLYGGTVFVRNVAWIAKIWEAPPGKGDSFWKLSFSSIFRFYVKLWGCNDPCNTGSQLQTSSKHDFLLLFLKASEGCYFWTTCQWPKDRNEMDVMAEQWLQGIV